MMEITWFQVAFIAALAVTLLSTARSWLSKASRMQKLGVCSPKVPHMFPLGFDLAWQVVTQMRNSTFVEYTREILKVPGRTAELNMLGSRLIFTDHPENMKAVMATKFSEFGKGHLHHEVFYSIFGDSIFSAEGDEWIITKNQLRPHISSIRPNDLAIAEQHIQCLFQRLRGTDRRVPVDIYDGIDRLLLDISTHIFFGDSTNSLKSTSHPFRNALDRLLKLNSVRLPLGKLALLFPDWLLAPKEVKVLQGYMDKLVDKVLSLPGGQLQLEAKPASQVTLMEGLAIQRPNRKFIRDQLIAVLLAGKDPVSILLTWAIFELSRHPELVKQLQAEIQATIGLDSLPNTDNIKGLAQLRNVVKETIRMYHPLGITLREARTDTCLPVGGGRDGTQPVAVLKGQQVAISVLGLQRHRESVPGTDPDVWDPTRWETWTPGPYEFVPFNAGPRICLGRNWGQLMIQYTLARILQEFEAIEWCGYDGVYDDSEPMRFKIELNTKMDKPVLCNFVERSHK